MAGHCESGTRTDCTLTAKPKRSAAQLHELVLARLRTVSAAEPEADSATRGSQPEIGMPHPHPTDPLGRNWDIAEARGLRRVAPVRVLIDSVREAFDLGAD